MAAIWQENPWYSALRPYTDMCTVTSYRQMEILGRRRIPKDGAIIIAPNHCNTLLDAMVVASFRKRPIVFGARADIFDNRTVAAILAFLRILPMVRKRDGIRKVLRNYETINQAVDVLVNGAPFCIFSEGTHRAKHSLLPINKGVTRVALEAVEKIGNIKPVYIIPTGIEYGDYFRYRSTCQLTFGEPVNVTEFLKTHSDMCEGDIHNALRQMIHDGIAANITYLPDDEKYDARWALLKIITSPLRGTPATRLKKSKAAEQKVCSASDSLLARALQFDEERRRLKISMHSFGRHALALKLVCWLLLLPVFVCSALMSLPMWGISEWLCVHKIKDRAFRNTARYGGRLLGYILMTIIWSVVLFICLPWYLALSGLFIFFFSLSFFYDYMEFSRRLISSCRLIGHKSLKTEFAAIRKEVL